MRTVPHTVRYEYRETFVKFRDSDGVHEVVVGAGRDDTLYTFREGDVTYILSLNRRLDYAGLDVFEGDDHRGESFLQFEGEIESVLGKRGLDLEPINIAKGMANWFWETQR
jgi:hypothetical protein